MATATPRGERRRVEPREGTSASDGSILDVSLPESRENEIISKFRAPQVVGLHDDSPQRLIPGEAGSVSATAADAQHSARQTATPCEARRMNERAASSHPEANVISSWLEKFLLAEL